MPIMTLIFIAFSLSMDAFSLSLAYGTLNFERREIYELSFLVGLFHFIMPILGRFFGSLFLSFLPIDSHTVIFVVLILIGLSMIFHYKETKEVKKLSFLEYFGFAFAVSFDSFSIGIGFSSLLSSFFFLLFSVFFTYLGLRFGTYAHQKLGELSTLIGGILLVLIGILYRM